MNFRRCVALIVLFVAGTGQMFGRIMMGLDLPALCERADAIIVGRVTDIRTGPPYMVAESGGSYPAHEEIARIAVDHRFKGSTGDVVELISLVHTGPELYNDAFRPVKGQYCTFFLRRKEAEFEALDPNYPFIEVMPGPAQVSGRPLDDVIAEIQRVILSSQTSAAEKESALVELRGSTANDAINAIRGAAHDPDFQVRVTAISELLRRNDISELAAAESILRDPPPGTDQRAIGLLASGIMHGVHDPSAILILTQLLVNRSVDVRRAAAYALRHTRSTSAIKSLAQALNDTDPEVLCQAVMGLAELTHTTGEWAPGGDHFLSDQKRYVEHWKEWAKQQPQ